MEKYLNHIKEVICSGNDEVFEYLLDWMADAIQNPGCLPGVAISIVGEQGTGKGFFAKWFAELFGSDCLYSPTANDLKFMVSDDNKLLVLSEDGLSRVSTLKSLITDQERLVEKRGTDPFLVKNTTRLICIGNVYGDAINADKDRRFLSLHCSNHKRSNWQYFEDIENEMKNGGLESFHKFLKERKILCDLKDTPFTNIVPY